MCCGFEHREAKTVGDIDVGTDDQQVAMLVLDRARGSNHAELCIYNKRSKRASVGAADLWSAPFQSNN